MCKFLLGDERMELCLLRRPALERINVQETSNEVDEGYSVIHLYDTKSADIPDEKLECY